MTPDYGSRLSEVLEELFTRKDGPQRLMEALVEAGMDRTETIFCTPFYGEE